MGLSPASRRRVAFSAILPAILYLCPTVSSFQLLPNSRISIPTTATGRSHRSYGSARLHSSPNGNAEGSSKSSSKRRSRAKKASITDKNLYSILDASPTMPRAELKRRYIALAKQTHPDASNSKIMSQQGSVDVDATDRFNEIAQAWTILSDAKTRRAYDRELAAQDFKDDVVKKAGEVAREYGPTARKFYEDFAIPLLRRTTATTLASWSAVAEATSDAAAENGRQEQERRIAERDAKYRMQGAKLSDVVKEVSEMERNNAGAGDRLEDFGRAFQRVIQAGQNATRQIDGMELQEKSMELHRRADETRAESMQVLEQLTTIKSERLRLTFHTSSANFTSTDAIQYLDGFSNQGTDSDGVTLMQRMKFKRHPIRKDIEAFTAAESEFNEKMQEKSQVKQQMDGRQRALQQAESDARTNLQAEERARKMLEEAQRQVAESQRIVAEAQKSMNELDTPAKRVDQELSKANTILKRKQDVVRRELKRKADKVEGAMFDQVDNGKVRLNPGFDKSSMNSMGFEAQNLAAIEELRKDEARIESEFLRLVDMASRLVSRSERLMLRSEELTGEQQEQMRKNNQ